MAATVAPLKHAQQLGRACFLLVIYLWECSLLFRVEKHCEGGAMLCVAEYIAWNASCAIHVSFAPVIVTHCRTVGTCDVITLRPIGAPLRPS